MESDPSCKVTIGDDGNLHMLATSVSVRPFPDSSTLFHLVEQVVCRPPSVLVLGRCDLHRAVPFVGMWTVAVSSVSDNRSNCSRR